MDTQTLDAHSAGTASFRELTALVRAAGFFRKATGRVLAELVLHLSLHLGGLALFVMLESWPLRLAALLVSAYGGLGLATNTHTSSHNATAEPLWLNQALTYFGYPFLFGGAATFWWNKHCVVHHPAPNVIGIDDDADLMPFFALNQDELLAASGPRRAFYRVQWVLIPLVLALNGFFTQYQGWRYLLRALRSDRRRAAHWIDLGVLLAHYGVWLFLPMLFFAPLQVLGLYVVRLVLMGYAMFIGFAPAHFPAEAAFVSRRQLDNPDYLLLQTATTVNFRTGALGRLVCSGVDYQIEHHLFPGVPHVFYPELSRLMEDFCRSRGYPYRTLSWAEATWKSLVVFARPKPVIAEAPAPRPA